MASSGGVNPRALAEAQRADEMFEVMRPPPSDGFDVDRDRPTPTGERKARGLVHADGDWHRSAHVWLVDARRGRLAMATAVAATTAARLTPAAVRAGTI